MSEFFSFLSGVTDFIATREEAEAQKDEADLIAREAERESERVGEERRKFQGKQALAFLKSGVSLTGSPLETLQATEQETGRQVESIRGRGLAQRRLLRKRAKATRRSGTARLFSTVAQAGGQITPTRKIEDPNVPNS